MKQFRDKVFVLKYGGDLLESEESIEDIAKDIDMLCSLGIHPVIVHGGGPQLDRELTKKGIKFKKIEGMRFYTPEIIEVAQKVFGKIGRDLRKKIEDNGPNPKIIPVENVRVKRIEHLGYVGKVITVNKLFSYIMSDCTVPILSLFGWDESGHLCNVNADDLAVAVAEELKAEKLIIHTSVDGVLDGKGKRITHLDLKTAEKMIKDGHIKGGMIPKVIHCLQSEKVGKIHIINGTIPHALLYEIFTEEGIGTEIVRT